MAYVPRPSSWPIRNERKHAAIVNSNVEIWRKLDAISNAMTSMFSTDRLDRGVDRMQNTVSRLESNINVLIQRLDADTPTLSGVDHRVTKLELLLLRMLPKCNRHEPFHHEPELEHSPKKSTLGREPTVTQDEHEVLLPQCLHYDISDIQTSSCQTESASD